jgi:hypothetical protein
MRPWFKSRFGLLRDSVEALATGTAPTAHPEVYITREVAARRREGFLPNAAAITLMMQK